MSQVVLLTVRKVMSVGVGSPYTLWDENQRLPRRAGASASARCPTIPRWLLGRRDRRVPRHLAPDGLALARLVPGPRPGGTDGSPRTGPAPQAHRHLGEDRPAVVARQPRGARVLHRVVDRPPAGPADRGGVRHPVQPPLPQRVAEGPRLHPPEARTRPPRARPGGDRRLARFGLAAHQEEGEASGGSPRLDRPERPADGPAGPPHLGAPGPDAIPPPAWRPPQEGLRRGGFVAVPSPRPPGAVLPHAGRRLLRQLVRDGLPGSDVARPPGPFRGRLGRWHHAQGRADPGAGGPLRRPTERGVVAAVRADAQPRRAAVELAEVFAAEQLHTTRPGRTRRPRNHRVDGDSRGSGVPAEPVPCLGTPDPADITFLTINRDWHQISWSFGVTIGSPPFAQTTGVSHGVPALSQTRPCLPLPRLPTRPAKRHHQGASGHQSTGRHPG